MQYLQPLVAALGAEPILVIGDAILDQYTWALADRVSPEAPVLVFQGQRREVKLGGATGVARLLRGLGISVSVATVVGEDAAGTVVRRLLKEEGIDDSLVVTDPKRPTTSKERLMGHSPHRHAHQVLRLDWESRSPLDVVYEEQFLTSLLAALPRYNCVVISDYGKGACTPRMLSRVLEAARDLSIPTLVDPAADSHLEKYKGLSVLKLNRVQAEAAVFRKISSTSEAIEVAQSLRAWLQCDAVVVTLDKDGIACAGRDRVDVIPTCVEQIYDITGAGDTVQAVLATGLAAKCSLHSLLPLANAAASLQIASIGVVKLEPIEIDHRLANSLGAGPKKLVEREALQHLCLMHQRLGRRIVLTNGCFDLLHLGHTQYLEEAASYGDLLIVAINSDKSVSRQKGDSRPIIDQVRRASLLSSLECVDYVTIFDEDTPHRLLEVLRPDILVKGGDYLPSQVVGSEVVLSYGGDVRVTAHVDSLSTSQLVQRIRQLPT